MGLRNPPLAVMAWMSTLEHMKAHGTIIRASCQNPACKHWWDWPVEDLIRELGSAKASVWDRHPQCERCDGEVLFLACLPGTPCRPLQSMRIPADGLPIQSLMDGWVGLRGI